MKKGIVAIIAIMMLFVASGCNLGGKSSSGPSSSDEIYSGSKGLSMSFVRNLPLETQFCNHN